MGKCYPQVSNNNVINKKKSQLLQVSGPHFPALSGNWDFVGQKSRARKSRLHPTLLNRAFLGFHPNPLNPSFAKTSLQISVFGFPSPSRSNPSCLSFISVPGIDPSPLSRTLYLKNTAWGIRSSTTPNWCKGSCSQVTLPILPRYPFLKPAWNLLSKSLHGTICLASPFNSCLKIHLWLQPLSFSLQRKQRSRITSLHWLTFISLPFSHLTTLVLSPAASLRQEPLLLFL